MNNRLILLFLTLFLGTVLFSGNMFAHDPNHEEKQAVSPAFRGHLSEAMKAYFALENAVFAGDTQIATEKAISLEKAFSGIKSGALSKTQQSQWQKQIQALQKATRDLASQKEIEGQRSAFLGISNALIDIVKAYGPLTYDTYLLHCPMAAGSGGHWLSDAHDIANPYFGESMASCGTFIETYAGEKKQKK